MRQRRNALKHLPQNSSCAAVPIVVPHRKFEPIRKIYQPGASSGIQFGGKAAGDKCFSAVARLSEIAWVWGSNNPENGREND